MNRGSLIVIFGVVALCASAGCQNTLEIRVERVLTTGDSHIRTDSRLGRRLTSGISSLEDFIVKCEGVENQIENIAASSDALRDSMKYSLIVVLEILKEAKELLKECEKYPVGAVIIAREEELQVTLTNVKGFFENSVLRFNKAMKQMEKREALKKMKPVIAMTKEVVAITDLASEGARKVSPLFGGFVAGDVYAIQPSDPMYEKIFAASSSRIKTSSEPITKVSIGVTGDSSIMIVVEHPGQIRVYQVSNDPTTIVRNIALLVSKATAAAAKFLASGTTP